MDHGPELVVVVIVCLVLAAGAATRMFSSRTRFPYTVAMLLLGLATGLALDAVGVGAGHPILALLHGGAGVTPDLIVFVFLPALVFESAFALDVHAFGKELPATVTLAVPALLLATALTGGLMVAATAASWHWSWPAALVFGALISATDPVAVVAILRETGAPKRLGVLIEGESLLNDGTSIVVFTMLLGLLAGGAHLEAGLGSAILRLGVVVGGGVAVGAVLGMVVTGWVSRTFNDPLVEITLTLALAYAAMIVAEGLLHVSGVLAVVTAGLWMSGPGRTRISPEVGHFLHQFWEMLSYIANTLIFFLVGLLIALHVHRTAASDLGLIIGAWAGIMLIRFVVTFAFRPLINRMGDPVSVSQATVMSWGGLRGAVSLALALVVSQTPGLAPALRAQVLQVTVGVVLLTILVNGTTTGWLLGRLGFDRPHPSVSLAHLGARASVLSEVRERIDEVATSPDLRTVNWTAVTAELEDRRGRLDRDLDEARRQLANVPEGERAAGLWRRALSLEREVYWGAFGEGTLGPAAASLLTREIDRQLDRLERGDLEPPATRIPEPGWLRALLARVARGLGWSSRHEIERLERVYDMSRAEARAGDEVRRAMAGLAGIEPEVVRRIEKTYLGYRWKAVERLEDLRVQLPELASAIETRLARRVELNFERDGYRHQLEHGGMEPAVAEEALAEVEERMKKLHFGARRVPLPETADLCRQTPLFEGLPQDAVDDLARMTVEQVFSPGQELFREGDRGDAMFVIARGAVRVLREVGGREEPVDVLGGGDILGEMALLTGEPRTATARAATTVTVGRISRHDFDQLMKTRPEVQAKVWETFSYRSLDNVLRALPGAPMAPDTRRAWAASGRSTQVAGGEAADVQGAAWVFVVRGAVTVAGAVRRGPALVEIPGGEPVVAGEPSRLLLLGPRPDGDRRKEEPLGSG